YKVFNENQFREVVKGKLKSNGDKITFNAIIELGKICFNTGFTAGVEERDKELLEATPGFDDIEFRRWRNQYGYSADPIESAKWGYNQLKAMIALRDEKIKELEAALQEKEG
ncbi:MAG TPA: hypothetical protein VHA52_04180, partial [Candidatus Babeliaceae bacterium]|nr:hypothetical protein [Candidatus Babeliaceae bacterium]